MHSKLGNVTVAAGFPQGKQPEFPMGEIPVALYIVVNKLFEACLYSMGSRLWDLHKSLVTENRETERATGAGRRTREIEKWN